VKPPAWIGVAVALASTAVAAADPLARPAVELNRAVEDWSPLADPALRTEPLDALKYIPLWSDDPKTYLSLGLTLRERFEASDVTLFGVTHRASDVHDLHRLQVHADLHLDASWNLFVQLEDVRAIAKAPISPVDENPLDLRQAFVMYQHPLGDGTFKLRVGRQQFSFDLQRFVSMRDGPNVQQAFDAVWAAWEVEPWKLIGFVSLPVEYARGRPFDDGDSLDDRFSMLRVERKLGDTIRASAYYARSERPNLTYLDAAGDERRDVVDARLVGAEGGWDWDGEGMGQLGRVGNKQIRAWGTGARVGYSIHPPFSTRFGLQFDTASGDRKPGDHELQTFDPLIPNGYYFTLASDPGYANLIHVKPSITQHLAAEWTVMGAVALMWRETTADAVYIFPNIPLPDTAGQPGQWSAYYVQLHSDLKLGPDLLVSIELVHSVPGPAIRAAGGTSSNYGSIEARLSL
jgi:hypothetical protein